MKLPRLLILALLASLAPVPAQEPPPAEKPAKPARQVRFLPVGDLPPYRQTIRDGVAYELEPPAGSIPPREAWVGFGEEKSDAVPLLLGRVSAPLGAPAGEGPLLVRRRDDAEEAEPWLRVNRPESGDFLVLLWRDPQQKTWERARAMVLAESADAAPAGRVRFVNVSPVAVAVVIGGERIRLDAGKTFQRPIAAGEDVEFQLGAVDAKGALSRFHSGALFQNPGERSLVVVYRADGVQPRRPLKAVVHREPVTPPPAAPAP
jgi:hypothetical protein